MIIPIPCAVVLLFLGVRLMAAAPELGFRNSNGQTQLVWPGIQLGFRVEANVEGLSNPVWRPIQEAASRIDGEYRLIVPQDSAMGFYRLAQVTEISGDSPGDFADSNGDGIDGDFSRAVFLAPPPFGNNQNPGTMQLPVATLEHAVELAETVPLKHDVYIAQGRYELGSPLRLPPRVSLFGQFDGTTNWGMAARYVTTISGPSTTLILGEYPGEVLFGLPVRLVGLEVIAANAIEPGESSKAVVIKDLKYSVSLERCVISAGAGAAPGGSSYGLFVANSLEAIADECRIVAGDGASGASGKNGEKGEAGGDAGDGKKGEFGGFAGIGGFLLGGLSGGNGGMGGLGTRGFDGSDGIRGSEQSGPLGGLGGKGGTQNGKCERGNDGLMGEVGKGGTPGRHGVAYESDWGSLTADGHLIPSGGEGIKGSPGGGGGGGGGGGSNPLNSNCLSDRGGGGGGGGGGGLPGAIGTGGDSGGSSVAVYSHLGNVTIRNSSLRAGNGGRGGNGGNGGNGGIGGLGGQGGLRNGDGANGGLGGKGGYGGVSGAGAGGPGGNSFCFLFKYEPVLHNSGTNNHYEIGVPGLGGDGGFSVGLGIAPQGHTGFALEVGSR